jgi:hypothetical protein
MDGDEGEECGGGGAVVAGVAVCKCFVLVVWGRGGWCLYRVERVCEGAGGRELPERASDGVVMMGITEEIIFIWRLIGSKFL